MNFKGKLHSKIILKGHTKYITNLAISKGDKFLVSVSGDKLIKIWDLSTKLEVKTLEVILFF